MTDLEMNFHKDMIRICERAKKECGYVATRFLRMINEKGGLMAAKQLIAKEGGTDGFATLWEHGRLDLSVEALVLQERYHALFTDEERELCRKRLLEYGYQI